jgi:hypothetical protein
VFRRICEPKRDELEGEWTQVHNVEFHSLYSSPNIKAIKSIRIRWVGNVVRIGR